MPRRNRNQSSNSNNQNQTQQRTSQASNTSTTSSQPATPKQGSQRFTPSGDLSQLTLNIKMVSDWHVGVGAGRAGDIDSLVVRDATNLPYIPAKTLTGMWRDACETVAWGLDEGAVGAWSDWVEFLFGNQPGLNKTNPAKAPRPAAITIRPATFEPTLVAALTAKRALQEAICFVKPGIGIDPVTGCAKENFLRFEEMVRGGATLMACCEPISALWEGLSDDQKATAQALLLASVRLIERVGGKRRRGAGRCDITLRLGQTELDLSACIERLSQSPASLPESPSLPPLTWHEGSRTAGAWQSVPLTITAQSPLILSSDTVGNVVQSLDYIPGSRLLPLLSKRLGREALAFAIAHGQVVMTNALPVIKGQRSYPTPFALFGEKLRGGLGKASGVVYNRLVEPEPDRQLKGERSGYITPVSEHLPYHLSVSKAVFTHNTVEDEVQRPTEAVGGVYSYEAIQAGTSFQAELRLPTALAQSLDLTVLGGSYSLGRSKKDEYGSVKIDVGTPQDCQLETSPLKDRLTVWLLSDLLLRDERLRPTTDLGAFASALGEALGCTLRLRDDRAVMSVLARDRRTESWQAAWGLPRPSLVGMAAGSCFVFEIVGGAITPDALTQVSITGLGERTAEGFGQLCLNHPLLTQPTSNLRQQQADVTASDAAAVLMNGNVAADTKAYARIIEGAAWHSAIRQHVLAKVATAEGRTAVLSISNTSPNLTQLGALRSVLGRLTAPEDSNTSGGIIGWLNHLESVPNQRDKWPHDVRQKIRALVTNPAQVWQDLGFTAMVEGELCLTHDGATKQKEKLWAEAVQTLIDGCIRARRREGGQ